MPYSPFKLESLSGFDFKLKSVSEHSSNTEPLLNEKQGRLSIAINSYVPWSKTILKVTNSKHITSCEVLSSDELILLLQRNYWFGITKPDLLQNTKSNIARINISQAQKSSLLDKNPSTIHLFWKKLCKEPSFYAIWSWIKQMAEQLK